MKLNEAKVESIESYKKIKKQKHNIIHGTNAITLIALVITIVILIILAGVAINLSIGENGIFSKAKQAREMMKISSVQEKLELEKTNLLLDSNEYTLDLQTYINKLIEKGIISSTDVENTEYDNSKLITVEGYVFLLTEEDKDIKIEVQGKVGDVIIVDRTKPVVTVMSNTANTATIKGSDNSSGIVGYVYAKTNTIPTNFIECENTLDLNITIENLDVNTTYYIWVKDAVGNISECKTVTTSVANYSLNSGVKYETLAQAVENAVTGDTIKVISDYTDTSDVSINKSLTLNTNGKTLTRTKTIEIENDVTVEIAGSGTLTTAEEINLITNNGTLNITHEGTISSTNTGASRVILNTGNINKNGYGEIINEGTYSTVSSQNGNINISSGSIISENSTTITVKDGNAQISNNAIITGYSAGIYSCGNAICEVKGGSINSTNLEAISMVENSTVNITGGTIEGNHNGIYCTSTGNLEVNKGTIIGSTMNGIYITEENTGNLTIKDGIITGNNCAICSLGKGNITISGGELEAITQRSIYINGKSSGMLTVTGGIMKSKSAGIRIESSKMLNPINISNVNINAGGTCIESTGSNIEINVLGGNFKGNFDAIHLISGDNVTLNVLGGNFTGTLYDGIGVYANATVNIGDSTKAIDNNSLIITGGNFGVFNSWVDCKATVNYYNGTLRGKKGGTGGNYSVRSGYSINTVTSGEYKEATLIVE